MFGFVGSAAKREAVDVVAAWATVHFESYDSNNGTQPNVFAKSRKGKKSGDSDRAVCENMFRSGLGDWAVLCSLGQVYVMNSILKDKRLEILEIARRYGVRNVRVFGSAARDEAGPQSDMDLLVEFGPGFTLLTQAAMVRELESLLGLKVDVVSERALRPRVRDSALREAAPL